ncbi:hypothetical protein [Pseudonocardia lacus]|uniref:hypothetical protein n=1 Tax=Pseudonocardia lacus TaxID=2835865 RepID=UPI001BDCF4B1|nr:hypothetical protein [Pseudonocardia lacus]
MAVLPPRRSAVRRVGDTGDLAVIRALGWNRFAAAARRELGRTRWYSAIVRAVFDAPPTRPGRRSGSPSSVAAPWNGSGSPWPI